MPHAAGGGGGVAAVHAFVGVAPRRLFAQSLMMDDDDSLLPAHCTVGPESRPNHARNASGLGRAWSSGIRHARFGSASAHIEYVRASLRLHYCVAWSIDPRNPGPTVHLV